MSHADSERARRNILALMEKLKGMPDDKYLESMLAYHAAPTLLGIKPATLVRPRALGRNPGRALGKCATCLARSHGVEMAAFRNPVGALLILAFNRTLLRDVLDDAAARSLLRDRGFDIDGAGVDSLLAQLGVRFSRGGFPHEIGVFLGYPADDVRCFIARGGRGCSVSGCWKGYGDAIRVSRRSALFRLAKLRAAELIIGGADLGGVVDGLRASAA